jgi:thiol:disulfide interchange protein DsbA
MSHKLSLLLLVATMTLAGCSQEPDSATQSNQASAVTEQGDSSVTTTKYQEGVDYRLVKDIDNEGATKPFIVEFFWLGCPHCQAFEAPLQRFIAANPDFTVVKKPAAGSARWALDAKIYYGLRELGRLDLLDQLFDLYRGKPLPTKTAVADFLTSANIDAKVFFTLIDSNETILALLNTNNQEMRLNNINGVPGIVVNGQYLLTPTKDTDFFDLVRYLSTQ